MVTSDFECLNPDQAPSDLKSWYAKCKAYSTENCEKCPLCEVSGSKCKLRNPSGCPFDENAISGSSGANAAVIAGATVGCILFVVIIIIIVVIM